MNRFYINVEYTTTSQVLAKKLRTKGSKTLLITFCLHVTGVYRLFDEESVSEFLYRLGIVFRHYNIVPKFFTNDTLLVFDDRGSKVEFCLDDISNHLGIEIWDGPIDYCERSVWIENIETYWKNAMLVAVFSRIPILDRRIVGKNKFIIGSNKPSPITPECESNASLFAKEALKSIGKELFADLSIRVANRKESLEEYRAKLLIKPRLIYDYEKIPIRVKKKIFKHLYGSIKKHKQFFKEEVSQDNSNLALLIKLAWLWQNGFITTYKICVGEDKYAYNAEVDERVDFQYSPYDGLLKKEPAIGINLYETYFQFGMDKVAYLLKEK